MIIENPSVGTLIQNLLGAAETDAISYAIASPSAVLAEIPPLFQIFNSIVSTETYFPTLTAAEATLGAQLTSIVSADAGKPSALASDVVNWFQSVIQNPTYGALVNDIVGSIPTDARQFVVAYPSAALSDVELIVSDANPIVATETFAPALTTLETKIFGDLSSIIKADVPATTAKPSASLTIVPFNSTQTIAPFKGAAPTSGLEAMAVIGAAAVGVMAML